MKMFNDAKCKLCKDDILGNCFGTPEDMKYICINCFEKMGKKKRTGIVPVSRTIITQEWKDYCAKYDLLT